MKSIIFNQQNNSRSALYHEIIEHEGRKFRIIMDIHNGSRKCDTHLSIMVPDGTWSLVVTAHVLDIELESYVKTAQKVLMDNCYKTASVKRLSITLKRYMHEHSIIRPHSPGL